MREGACWQRQFIATLPFGTSARAPHALTASIVDTDNGAIRHEVTPQFFWRDTLPTLLDLNVQISRPNHDEQSFRSKFRVLHQWCGGTRPMKPRRSR